MNFFQQTGVMAIGSRLRMLSERITEDSKQLYDLYEVGLKPKWFPVFYVLSSGEARSITEIAEEIGHSHPSVVRIVQEMHKADLTEEGKDPEDGRRSLISLSEKGREIERKIQGQYQDVAAALEDALSQTRHNLWKALEEMEYLLDQKPLLQRVKEKKKTREADQVAIMAYAPRYRTAFRKLNEAWITQYFKMEEADHQALDHPEEYILSKGGRIIVALYQNEAVGVCALIKMKNTPYDYELAKMAVSPKAQGKGIGWLLGQAVIQEARSLGAKSLYLESNTILEPAINLYRKLGFRKVSGHASPYERSNIQMELMLD